MRYRCGPTILWSQTTSGYLSLARHRLLILPHVCSRPHQENLLGALNHIGITCAVSARLVVTPKVGPEGLNVPFLLSENSFLFAAVQQDGWALQNVDPELKKDRVIVLASV